MAYQFGLLDSKEENERKLRDFELGKTLPVSPLQEKHTTTPTLTEREFEIMDMTLKGYEIHEIALKIFLSIHGVKWRLSQVYAKFGVPNRLQLIKKSAREGLQFYTSSGIKHTFHNNLDMRAHEKDKKNEKD